MHSRFSSVRPRTSRRASSRPGLAVAIAVVIAACSDTTPPEPPAFLDAARPTASVEATKLAPPTTMDAGAALSCPPQSFVTGINLATNPSFESGGGPVSYPPGPNPPPSAAAGWFMHTSNQNAPVASARVTTTVPGPGGARMLAFRAGGNEGGVYQYISTPPRVMFSAWVYVRSGQVQLGVNGASTGPHTFSTKQNEWEQLRICTDGSVPTGYFFIVNQDPSGGFFYTDRVEVKEIP